MSTPDHPRRRSQVTRLGRPCVTSVFFVRVMLLSLPVEDVIALDGS